MKRKNKIILIIILVFIIGLFIHPQKIIYEPKVIGKIIDENKSQFQMLL